MSRNIFKMFLNKFMSYPLWIKQVVYYRLWQNMVENNCDKYIINYADGIFALHVPTLTFQGKQELWDKKSGLDSNIYNFLKYVHSGYTVLEIALNMFLSVEEVAKLYVFCIEQNFIEVAPYPEIQAMSEFIAGKIKTGEYFLKNGSIEIDQLDYAIAEQRKLDDRGEHFLIGKILVRLGYITEETIRTLFKLKADSKKRFVLNPNSIPASGEDVTAADKLQEENDNLKKENQALKKTLSSILNTVKNYDI